MRTEKALKNTLFSVASYCILIILGFVIQRVFKDALGKEFLGVNSLFSNVMSGLSIVEMGFGSAIIANMYRPIAEKNTTQIQALLGFYKKVYWAIAGVVSVIGICLLPFINKIVGSTNLTVNLQIIFVFYLIDSVVSYFITYKRSMLYANQQTYMATSVHTVAVIITNVIQIVILIYTKNFYLYLLTSIALRIVENMIINMIVNRMYPYVNTKTNNTLDKESVADIKRKVHGLLYHKLASFVVLGSDNIIISMMPGLGVAWVGVYSSYALITTKLTQMIDNVFSSITASVGNLLVEDNSEKSYLTFKNIQFVNTWIYVFVAIGFYFVSFPFVRLWMGADFVLDKATVFVIALNLYIGGLRASFGVFKNAAGIFYEDRFVAIIEALVNILTAIPLAYRFGLKGVLIGTICSSLVLFVYSFPKFVYHRIFNKGISTYVRDMLKSVVLFAISIGASASVLHFIQSNNPVTQLTVSFVTCMIIPNLVMIVFNFKSKELQFIKDLVKRLLKKR